MDVGAGDVQLVGRDALGVVEPLNYGKVLAHRVAEDVDDDLAVGIAAERGQLAFQVVVNANVLQADGVKHSGCRLHNARRVMAGHWLQRDALGDEPADPLQGDDLLKLDAIAKGAAGGDDRVDQFQTSQRNSHIGFHAQRSSFYQWSVIRSSGPVCSVPPYQPMMTFLLSGGRLDGLFQHAAHCRRGLIDAGKRGQRGRQINRGHTSMILARNKRRSVESQRNMAVIRPWAEVRGPGKSPRTLHLVGIQHQHHVPVSVFGITVGQQPAPF